MNHLIARRGITKIDVARSMGLDQRVLTVAGARQALARLLKEENPSHTDATGVLRAAAFLGVSPTTIASPVDPTIDPEQLRWAMRQLANETPVADWLERRRGEKRTPVELKKLQIIDRYLAALGQAAEAGRRNVERSILTIDTTGQATGFKNWATDPAYRAILEADQNAVDQGVNVKRDFLIDPEHMDDQAIVRLDDVLRAHAHAGIDAGIVLTDDNTLLSPELMSDIGILGPDQAVDFGQLEIEPQGVFLKRRDGAKFRKIRERVATADKAVTMNIPHDGGNIDEIISEISFGS